MLRHAGLGRRRSEHLLGVRAGMIAGSRACRDWDFGMTRDPARTGPVRALPQGCTNVVTAPCVAAGLCQIGGGMAFTVGQCRIGAVLEQRADQLVVFGRHGLHQRGVAVVVLDVRVGAVIEQLVQSALPWPTAQISAVAPSSSRALTVGAVGEQGCHDAAWPGRGDDQGRGALLVARVDVGAMPQQQSTTARVRCRPPASAPCARPCRTPLDRRRVEQLLDHLRRCRSARRSSASPSRRGCGRAHGRRARSASR
jgi:hypothetical protein